MSTSLILLPSLFRFKININDIEENDVRDKEKRTNMAWCIDLIFSFSALVLIANKKKLTILRYFDLKNCMMSKTKYIRENKSINSAMYLMYKDQRS